MHGGIKKRATAAPLKRGRRRFDLGHVGYECRGSVCQGQRPDRSSDDNYPVEIKTAGINRPAGKEDEKE